MPELTPTGAVDVVQRQVRRVRRRKNRYELQRTLYLTIAAGAAAATLLLPLALFAPAAVFAIGAWSMLAIAAGIGLFLVGAARRRWLARNATVTWIEARGGLGGRLRTLLELAARPAGSPSFFHALLVAQIGRDLETWTPRRLVPRGVPRAALATALVALAVLAVTLRLAALAVPAAPNVITSDQPLTGTRADGPSDATGERVVVAPGVPQPGAAGPAAADSTLTRLSSALQENVRQQIWGKAWERVRDTLARASTSSGSRSHDPPTEYGDEGTTDESEEWEIARAPSGELTRRRRPGNAGQSGAGGEERADAPGPDVASRPAGGESDDDANGGGAGNTTSPGTLFGAPSADTDAANGSFELSLAARMRADRERGRRAAGPPPDADPDARPVLAADQRRESAAHRMAVPAAYETVVREVFAHHGAESTHP
jgi:hypothetical protein